MGKHKDWRKLAKKLRRKRIRSKLAKERDHLQQLELEKLLKDPSYRRRLAEQEAAEEFEIQEEARISEEQNQLWLEREAAAQDAWKERQLRLAVIQEEKARQIVLLKEKLREEEQKLKEEKEKAELAKEEAQHKRERLAAIISEYISGDCKELPAELCQPFETAPGRDPCPFYSKVGACRFYNQCSRNHVKPGVSRVLMFPGFYSHFSLFHHEEEVDNELGLEFENSETNKYFLEFYEDIVPELGAGLKRILVCYNGSAHLRGNVFAEFDSERQAVAIYTKLNGRYYAGKQLSVEFVTINSWHSAVCGQQWWSKCLKGSQCNFLHVFKHPHRTLHGKLLDRLTRSRMGDRPFVNNSERSLSPSSSWSSRRHQRENSSSRSHYSSSRHRRSSSSNRSNHSPHSSRRHHYSRRYSNYSHSSKESSKRPRRKRYSSSSSSSSPSPKRNKSKMSDNCKNGWDSDTEPSATLDTLSCNNKE